MVDGKSEIGLADDNIEKARALLSEKYLILSPHEGDEFAFTKNTTIPLEASTEAEWYVNGKLLGPGVKISLSPAGPGTYDIEARTSQGTRETIRIIISEQ